LKHAACLFDQYCVSFHFMPPMVGLVM